MDNEIGSIDNDGNVTDTPITDDFNDMTASNDSYKEENSYETTSDDSEFNSDDGNSSEEFDVFGNSVETKKSFSFNKKLLLIPLVIVIILIILMIISLMSGSNKYTIKNKSFIIKVDETATIEIIAKDKVKQKITYSSENDKIASVDKNGKITGETIGTTTIYVGVDGKKSDKVTVKVETNKEELTLKETNITVNKDETYKLEVTKVLEDDVFEWSSNNENVAIVDEEGIVTGIHAGTATIVVRESDGRSVSTRVTVVSDEVLINTIEIQSQTIAIGEKITLTPTINPANGLKILSWKSSKESVATVDKNGLITGVSKGTTTITVETHNGKRAQAKITVDETLPASIKLSGCTGGIAINTPITLTIDYSPSTAKSNITWTSSNPEIATVSNGKVTAKSTGKVMISATTQNGKTAICNLTVSPMSITNLTVSPATVTLDQEASKKLSVTLTPTTAKQYYTINWTSSNTNVAIVDSEGKVTGINPGTATITASAGGKSAKVTVTVNATSVTSIQMTGCQTTAKVDDSFKLTATALPATAKNKTITWSSSNTAIATVSNGNVKIKDVGTVTITASTKNGKKATCQITVLKPDITSLTLDKTATINLKVNGTTTLTASTNLSALQFNKFYKMYWTSSRSDVASITVDSSNSLKVTIKALKAGATTIQGTVGGRVVSVQVIVS